jgi:hypothetical protein
MKENKVRRNVDERGKRKRFGGTSMRRGKRTRFGRTSMREKREQGSEERR